MRTIQRRIAVIVLALAVLGVAGWLTYRYLPEGEEKDPNLIARVGPREIRAARFKAEAARRGGARRQGLDRRALLEDMIDYETLLVKAFEAGLDKDPEVVRAYHNLLVGKLRQRELEPRIEAVSIADEAVAAYYQNHLDRFTRPARIRIALLFFETRPAMGEDKRESIRRRLSEARAAAESLPPDTRGFGALAVRYSEDQASRYKGGDIGWLAQGRAYRWPTPVVTAGFSLREIGDVSDILETEDGFYLVKLLDRRPSVVKPLSAVEARIRHTLLLEKRRETEAAFMAEKRATTGIEIFSDALRSVPLPERGKADTVPPSPP